MKMSLEISSVIFIRDNSPNSCNACKVPAGKQVSGDLRLFPFASQDADKPNSRHKVNDHRPNGDDTTVGHKHQPNRCSCSRSPQ